MVDFTSRYPRSSTSFSSSLLDAIYRSIDREEDEVVIYRESTKSEEMANFRRARMIEKRMEEKVNEKVVVDRKSIPDNFSLSSSDSSISEVFPIQRPKPIRTAVPATVGEILEYNRSRYANIDAEQTPKRGVESGLLKTKSRALKLYADLKKVKQPISPGGKLAGLLNSFFSGGNSKKPKISNLDSASLKSSTCSSASSFSNKMRGKSEKRSVRFSPVSVIFNGSRKMEGRNNGVEEMVREIVEEYQGKKEETRRNWEEDDAGSCGSSDLFELDNLPKWGMQELPVYETTCLPNSNSLHYF